jgi:hypothetical protein
MFILVCRARPCWPTTKARISAALRAVSLAFSITQCDVVPSAEPDADRNPCAVWLD